MLRQGCEMPKEPDALIRGDVEQLCPNESSEKEEQIKTKGDEIRLKKSKTKKKRKKPKYNRITQYAEMK